MRFQVSEIRVKTKTLCPEHFTWLQRLAIRLLKIPVEQRYHHDFYITCFKENYLEPHMMVLVSGSHIMCRVISKSNDKFTVVMSSLKPMTLDHGKLLCTSKEGAYIGSLCAEGANFKRKIYG